MQELDQRRAGQAASGTDAAGLIEVAATRMVSGILEQRYRARQRDLRLSAALIRRYADESEAAIRAAFDAFLTGVFDRARQEDRSPDGPDKRPRRAIYRSASPSASTGRRRDPGGRPSYPSVSFLIDNPRLT